MNDFNQQATDYQRIEAAIHFIDDNFRTQPSLEAIAAHVNLSKYHFQRLFKQWAGISPTQFLHFLTVDYAKQRLTTASSVFDAALDAGLSGGGRLHDMFVSFEAMTPGEYKKQALGLTIEYGVHPTPFGHCLLAVTPRGICALRFVEEADEKAVNALRAEWALAHFRPNPAKTAAIVNQIFAEYRPTSAEPAQRFNLLLRGTNFQVQVWRALLKIPAGQLVTYSDVATAINRPQARRAVANAIANNPVGFLIPCHRVISKIGHAHNYRWGAARKKAIIGYEAALLA